MRGPETQASISPVPNNAEFFGIILRVGTHIPIFPVRDLVNDAAMPAGASSRSFWLQGAAWEYPTFDNAETFVARLVANDLVVHEPMVDEVMRGRMPDISLRTVQRRFHSATGLTHSAIQQIERARKAAILLKEGMSILDTVEEAGYYDQPHLTKSLKHYIGQTPAQLADPKQAALLSLLYKTELSG